MRRDENLQNNQPVNEAEPVESLATIIPRLLALRGLTPLADAGSLTERPKSYGMNRSVASGRAI